MFHAEVSSSQDTETEIMPGEFDDPPEEAAADLDDYIDQPRSLDSLAIFMQDMGRHKLLTAEQEIQKAKAMEKGLFAVTLRDWLGSVSPEQQPQNPHVLERYQRELEEIIELGDKAKREMIECNLRLVHSVASRYLQTGIPLSDLIQDGTIGLIRAVEKFDHRMGNRFSTPAVWWIRQAIQRGIAKNAEIIKLPTSIRDQSFRLKAAEQRLLQRGLDPTVEEIATEAKVPVDEAREALEVTNTLSLNQKIADDTVELGGLLMDKTAVDPSQEAGDLYQSALLKRALNELPPKHQGVIALRFGLWDDIPLSKFDVAKQLGLPRERVGEMEEEALAFLKQHEELRDPDNDVKFAGDVPMSKKVSGATEHIVHKIDTFSDGQNVIANLMIMGYDRREIAEKLGASVSTIKGHELDIAHKVGSNHRADTVEKLAQLVLSR